MTRVVSDRHGFSIGCFPHAAMKRSLAADWAGSVGIVDRAQVGMNHDAGLRGRSYGLACRAAENVLWDPI